jgi:hypothetical protein
MDQIVTKTMVEVYLKQGLLQEAYDILKVLSERDPFDPEIEMKLKELGEQLNPSPSLTTPLHHPTSERVHALIRWLDNIKKRKRI